MSNRPHATNRELLAPYLLPLILYVGIGALPEQWLSREWSYAARIVSTGAALVWARSAYVPLTGPGSPWGSVLIGALTGLAGSALWIGMLAPLVGPGSAWSESAFLLRALTATLMVPLFEELLMRGYLLRFVVQLEEVRTAGTRDALGETLDRCTIFDVKPGAWTPLAVMTSTVVFALGHALAEWPAALAYGLLMAGLWILRKDLLSCVVAHAVTNLGLALYVHETGQWGLW